jgi:hypothetical protein
MCKCDLHVRVCMCVCVYVYVGVWTVYVCVMRMCVRCVCMCNVYAVSYVRVLHILGAAPQTEAEQNRAKAEREKVTTALEMEHKIKERYA